MKKILFQTLGVVTGLGCICALLLITKLEAQERMISGKVVDDSGHAVPGVSLSLSAPRKTARTTVTNPKGQFSFSQLADTDYRIKVVWAPGYYEEPEARNQNFGYQAGDTVTIRLTKGGVIAGQVRDQDGSALPELRIRALRVRDEKGEPVSKQENYTRETDDRGMYRVFGLKPGAYVVCAEGDQTFMRPSAYRFNATFWYLSGTRPNAVEINVASGSVTENVDISYRAQKGHSISGTVVKGVGAPPGASVYLLDPSSGIILQSTPTMLSSPEFILSGIGDGEYEIEASTSEKPDQSRMISPKQRVKVKEADVSGVQLTMASLGTIQAKILLEPLTDDPCPQSLRLGHLSLEAVIDNREKSDARFNHAEAAPDEKGVCLLLNLVSGKYRFNLSGLATNWYLKQITDSKLNDAGLVSLAAGGRAEVAITLASGAATLSGKAPKKSRLYLVPDQQTTPLKLVQVRTAQTNDDGAFVIGNLAPGSYRVFARAASAKDTSAISVEELPQIKKDAEVKGMLIELKPCQQLKDVKLP